MSAAFNAPFWLKKIIDHKKKLSCIKWLQMQSYSWPWKKTHHTASERHRTAIPTQFMLWKQCCQAALSLTLSCDNPSSVIHKLLLFGAGKDIKAILIQPVSLSSQDGRVGDCRSTTLLHFSNSDTFSYEEYTVHGIIWADVTMTTYYYDGWEPIAYFTSLQHDNFNVFCLCLLFIVLINLADSTWDSVFQLDRLL